MVVTTENLDVLVSEVSGTPVSRQSKVKFALDYSEDELREKMKSRPRTRSLTRGTGVHQALEKLQRLKSYGHLNVAAIKVLKADFLK